MASTPEPFEVQEPLMLVSVQRTYTAGDDAYEAASGSFTVSTTRPRAGCFSSTPRPRVVDNQRGLRVV